jgi:hypothetical protein
MYTAPMQAHHLAPHFRDGSRLLLAITLLISAALAAAAAETTAAPSDDYEAEPTYSADQLLEPSLLSGPGWRIEPEVPVRGYLAQFRVATEFGDLQVEGRAELLERIHEIEVIGELVAISRSKAFATAIGHSGKDIAKIIGRIGTHPIRTLTSIPTGLVRSLRSKWRDLREQSAKARDQAAEELREDDTAPGIGPQPPTPHARDSDWWLKSQKASGKLAKRWLGFSKVRRELARRMAVDPYSRNLLLNRELDRIAWASLVGEKSLGAAIDAAAPGVSEALGWSQRVDDVVWTLDPVALGRLQQERMAAICGADPMIARSMHQGSLSPTQWQALVDSIEALGVRHCAPLLELIAATETDAEARYLLRALALLEAHRGEGDTIELAVAGRMLVARIGRQLVVPMPVDVLSWTAPVAALFDDPALRAAEREMWLDGEATMRAQRELTRRGFGLRLDLPRSLRGSMPLPPGFDTR